jgi:hypothetical protein
LAAAIMPRWPVNVASAFSTAVCPLPDRAFVDVVVGGEVAGSPSGAAPVSSST